MGRPNGRRRSPNKEPYLYFLSNNFLISRCPKFDPVQRETFRYGHEDTLLSCEMSCAEHPRSGTRESRHARGIGTAEEYLRKTEQSIANLRLLMGQNIPMDHIKLVGTI